MKIAHVVCVYPPYRGGIGNVAKDFSFLMKSDNEVTVFTPTQNDLKLEEKKGIKIKYLKPFLKYGNGAFLPQLFFKLKDFDIVHLHYPFFGVSEIVYLAKLFFKKKFKLIIHYHMDTDNLSFFSKILSIFSWVIFKPLFEAADKITFASEDYILRSRIKNFYQKNKQKFYLLPFGVDTDKFFPDSNKKEKNKINILFVGGLDKAHYFKGVNILLKALSSVLNDKTILNIIGQGDMMGEYKKIVQESKIEKYVNFLGGVNDCELVKNYQKANIFVLPSINSHEAFGVVLLEAFACGTPVIASNLPGVRSVFKDKQEGFLIKPSDIFDLREKINFLIADKNLRQQMGINARKLACEKYSFKILKERLKKIYNI
ncbi:glycosyltransferase family 4 protein [Candidatus Parcubacteria bacterium]|nr:glycosyltransferase family 4 protein [Candidatus Parcubacteria bacterium]